MSDRGFVVVMATIIAADGYLGFPAAGTFVDAVSAAATPYITLMSRGIGVVGSTIPFVTFSVFGAFWAYILFFTGGSEIYLEEIERDEESDLGDHFHEADDGDGSGETITLRDVDGETVVFDADSFDPKRIRVGDRYAWVAEHEGEPIEVDPDMLSTDPTDHTRAAYVDGEIDEDELEERLEHDLSEVYKDDGE
ncbi:hypothetical protein [Halorubrum cibi]|uniref:Uncharacterized protein n=1 Tax=Halorubrum cibi TaxID=413815 RepID=A0A521EBV0_9EURY|nr:hypothetical protein [Halorubrum cibi]SMO81395.1 hypothetical protein SAMN06264867_11014 [Halorubrum cibi]